MEKKYISTQKELDAVIGSNWEGLVIIKDTKEEINIRDNGKCLIHVSGNAQIGTVSGNAQIGTVYENAQIRTVYENAQIGTVYENAQIRTVSGNAQIRTVSGNAQIGTVYENGLLNVYSSSVTLKNLLGNAIVICYEKPKILKKSKSVRIVTTKKCVESAFSLQKFIDRYEIQEEGDFLILYKSVKNDYTDFYSGKIKYEVGKVVGCPDWDPDYEEECGKGLHLADSPLSALAFNEGKVLKCRVKRKDCKTVNNPEYPTKVRCKEVEVIEEVESFF